MSPFSVAPEQVRDRALGPLLAQLAEAGFAAPIIQHAGADGPSKGGGPPVRAVSLDLPDDWRLLQEREGESYGWPKRRDAYAPYRVFMGTTRAEGAVQIGPRDAI